jgi:hypothetical protein
VIQAGPGVGRSDEHVPSKPYGEGDLERDDQLRLDLDPGEAVQSCATEGVSFNQGAQSSPLVIVLESTMTVFGVSLVRTAVTAARVGQSCGHAIVRSKFADVAGKGRVVRLLAGRP